MKINLQSRQVTPRKPKPSIQKPEEVRRVSCQRSTSGRGCVRCTSFWPRQQHIAAWVQYVTQECHFFSHSGHAIIQRQIFGALVVPDGLLVCCRTRNDSFDWCMSRVFCNTAAASAVLVLQNLLKMPQLKVKISTMETTAGSYNSGGNWGMFSKFCSTKSTPHHKITSTDGTHHLLLHAIFGSFSPLQPARREL